MKSLTCIHIPLFKRITRFYFKITCCVRARVYFGRSMDNIPDGAIVIFPFQPHIFHCGLAGIVAFKKKKGIPGKINMETLEKGVDEIEAYGSAACVDTGISLNKHYLGGDEAIDSTLNALYDLKKDRFFKQIYFQDKIKIRLTRLSNRLGKIIEKEVRFLSGEILKKEAGNLDMISQRLETLKDMAWCLNEEILENVEKINDLMAAENDQPGDLTLTLFKNINAVLNSINRLEVRGRDSAGLSLIFILGETDFNAFKSTLASRNLNDQMYARTQQDILLNKGISLNETTDEAGNKIYTITFVYKIAAEIGSLGDNIVFLRRQIREDVILRRVAAFPFRYHTISSHTRWASVGAITEANCHPVDNSPFCAEGKNGIIHVCLNGDIDNFQALKEKFETNAIPKDITTDTKIIPLQIEYYLEQGHDVTESFRLAVNDFEGSHAVSMHTDLSPGKLFLAQKGSGQAIFVGLASDHFMPVSEVYGFIEETSDYLKIDGEKIIKGKKGKTQGQIFILDQSSCGGIDGITAMYYDGSDCRITDDDIMHTDITSRDIDRQDFPHYFLKEISEAPSSVEKTLQSRWKLNDENASQYNLNLDHTVIPPSIQQAIRDNTIRRLFFIGQGTAGVAAQTCSDILNYYLDDPSVHIRSLKSSELSGFHLNDDNEKNSMADALIIAISQSGTTTDTNRCMDMAKERGASTLAIVNRRESDLTFKVGGVIYTSSGRDIEMSVASTKAFYSQIIAGAILGLFIAQLKGRRDSGFISRELKQLLMIPEQMRHILSTREQIAISARRLAATKTYWATVGSGPNKSAADEIRIKLSELCYKTISSDFIEDKKHIDLSSEPLIIVCAAGTSGTVIGDIIKDTAIFKAHKAAPVVIADQGETRFFPYAEDVLFVPKTDSHLAPILNTLVGHIWGYHAALAIHEGSQILFRFRNILQQTLDEYAKKKMDIYEVVLEKSFKEKIMAFYKMFREKGTLQSMPVAIGVGAATDLTLLLKYLSGRLPASDFELDFGVKGTALNMLNALFAGLNRSINALARPVDAIKHQAKTVTVGTSRISDRTEGILFEAVSAYDIAASQLLNRNVAVLKNLQHIVSRIEGAIFYRISDLNLLGEPTDETKIQVIKKAGTLKPIPSRVETDPVLKGTKRIIIQQGNVYIGKGRKDDRSIIVIPALSTSPAYTNRIEYLLLLNIGFKVDVSLGQKIKALGGKYEHIKNIVHENSMAWYDRYLESIRMSELFGWSAEKLAEYIVEKTE